MLRRTVAAVALAALALPASAEVAYDSLTGAVPANSSYSILNGFVLRQSFTPTETGYLTSITVADFNRVDNGGRHVARLFSGDALIGVCQVTYGQAPLFLDGVTPFAFTFEDECVEIVAGAEYVVEFSHETGPNTGNFEHWSYQLDGFPAVEYSADGGASYSTLTRRIPLLVEIEDEPLASVAHPRPTDVTPSALPVVGSSGANFIAQRQTFRAQGTGIVDTVAFGVGGILGSPVGPMRVSIETDTGIILESVFVGEDRLAEFLHTNPTDGLRRVKFCGVRLINNQIYRVVFELPYGNTSGSDQWQLEAVKYDTPAEFPAERRGIAGPDTWDVYSDLAVIDMQVEYRSEFCIADVQTTNTNPGDSGYGAPDGIIDGADLSYYVEQWLAGCP